MDKDDRLEWVIAGAEQLRARLICLRRAGSRRWPPTEQMVRQAARELVDRLEAEGLLAAPRLNPRE